MGLYDKALALIERAPESIKKAIISKVPYIYLNNGDFERALEEEQELARTRPPDYWLRGHAFFLLDDFKQAEENYRKLVESEDLSTRAAGHFLLHFAYKAQGEYDRAAKEAARVIEIAEGARQPLWRGLTVQALVTMKIITGDLPGAKGIVDDEIRQLEEEKLPPNVEWIFLKTLIAAKMKSFEEAKKALSEHNVLNDKDIQNTENPNYIRYEDWLTGVVGLEENDLPGAIANLEKAVSMFPVPHMHSPMAMSTFLFVHSFLDYADYLNPLARAYFESGDLEKARKQYEALIGLSAGRMYSGDIYAKSFYMLGQIYDRSGKKKEARANYRKFLELWKNADLGLPEVEDAKKRLVGLNGP
jgi:tetratricopeptide (TPR) repeat protein